MIERESYFKYETTGVLLLFWTTSCCPYFQKTSNSRVQKPSWVEHIFISKNLNRKKKQGKERTFNFSNKLWPDRFPLSFSPSKKKNQTNLRLRQVNVFPCTKIDFWLPCCMMQSGKAISDAVVGCDKQHWYLKVVPRHHGSRAVTSER